MDWLGISMDFDKKLKNKLFESQKTDDYMKWLKLLLEQRDAYLCFCKNYLKCEKNCSHSQENIDTKNFHKNKDIIYVRFKNTEQVYKYHDYIDKEEKEFESNGLGDFILFKNFNNQFTDSFVRVVDDEIFKVTHIIEDKVCTYDT
jgi:glutamyl/glutaminyl-tRNA synthetase